LWSKRPAAYAERDELRVQLRDLIAERGDQLLLRPLAHVRRDADGVHGPMIGLAMCDECSDADDRVVDVLRKLVADGLSDLYVGLARSWAAANPPRSSCAH
jgi:hypothetical protein